MKLTSLNLSRKSAQLMTESAIPSIKYKLYLRVLVFQAQISIANMSKGYFLFISDAPTKSTMMLIFQWTKFPSNDLNQDDKQNLKAYNQDFIDTIRFDMKLLSKKQVYHINHPLNTSPTKNVCSFLQAQRFTPPKNCSTDRYYEIPSVFQSRSVSPGRRFRNSLESMRGAESWRDYMDCSLDGGRRDKSKITTFGIGREEYYLSKKPNQQLGPGSYTLKGSLEKRPFYMGKRIEPKIHDRQPNCATYLVSPSSLQKLSTTRSTATPTMKKQYKPKGLLDKYDNQVPGPGAYSKKGFADKGANSYRDSFRRKKANSTFGVGERMKTERPTYLGPGSYNRFSQFGRSPF